MRGKADIRVEAARGRSIEGKGERYEIASVDDDEAHRVDLLGFRN